MPSVGSRAVLLGAEAQVALLGRLAHPLALDLALPLGLVGVGQVRPEEQVQQWEVRDGEHHGASAHYGLAEGADVAEADSALMRIG